MDFKKILVAVDASENSSRAVEYVGQMLGNAPGFQISLLYVERHPDRDVFPDDAAWQEACRRETQRIRDFLDWAKRLLEQRGIAPGNLGVEYASAAAQGPQRSGGYSVARHVLRFQEQGGFGTVVVGRRGVSKAEEFLFGSVTTKIIHNAKGCTIWVVE